ncbi:hypothetical protein PoB_006970800 [Plakobranchus ocellatus]|uniref:Uncharacterized protein n=1 Tax=Plakobranchus ocellatus TaxID=259542 RepID=A0AAV4DFZ1_9GAST|nr:hypothetical protein PoB_006970800 [Plakobranchus ocellatus]
MISGFQALRQSRILIAGSNPLWKCSWRPQEMPSVFDDLLKQTVTIQFRQDSTLCPLSHHAPPITSEVVPVCAGKPHTNTLGGKNLSSL